MTEDNKESDNKFYKNPDSLLSTERITYNNYDFEGVNDYVSVFNLPRLGNEDMDFTRQNLGFRESSSEDNIYFKFI